MGEINVPKNHPATFPRFKPAIIEHDGVQRAVMVQCDKGNYTYHGYAGGDRERLRLAEQYAHQLSGRVAELTEHLFETQQRLEGILKVIKANSSYEVREATCAGFQSGGVNALLPAKYIGEEAVVVPLNEIAAYVLPERETEDRP